MVDEWTAGAAAMLCDELRATRVAGGSGIVICDVGAVSHADVGTVDALARVQLVARRHGCQVRLRRASSELRELLGLVGLREILPCGPGSGLQAGRETEEGEDPRGIEEERDPADPPVGELHDLE